METIRFTGSDCTMDVVVNATHQVQDWRILRIENGPSRGVIALEGEKWFAERMISRVYSGDVLLREWAGFTVERL